jgi:GNAT superfamily N-acetyltransferase
VPVTIRRAVPGELELVVAIDDDAGQLYDSAGLHLDLPDDHPFIVNERAHWRRAIELGDTFVALDDAATPIGFAALERVDGAPYLEQLSVRLTAMRRGVGRALLERAVAWARERGDVLWLNTYGHLPWNRPFYEKEGFTVVPPAEWGPEMMAIVADQRRTLPAPEHRVVMRRAF